MMHCLLAEKFCETSPPASIQGPRGNQPNEHPPGLVGALLNNMDITSYVADKRDRAFLLGDYNFYRGQLSRQLLTLRRKLKIATPKNAKYSAKASVDAELIAKNKE